MRVRDFYKDAAPTALPAGCDLEGKIYFAASRACLMSISQLLSLNKFKSTKLASTFFAISANKTSPPSKEKTLFKSIEILAAKCCIFFRLENAGSRFLPSTSKIHGSNGVVLESWASCLICSINSSCVNFAASRNRLGRRGINIFRLFRYSLSRTGSPLLAICSKSSISGEFSIILQLNGITNSPAPSAFC
jgi:hypothetical protein